MKTIIAPIDFSPCSLNAARYAADMALPAGARIILFHVCIIPLGYGELPVAYNTEEIRMDAEKEIKELQEELNRRNKGKTELLTKVIIGSYLPELKLLCDAVMPYAVVIGSQGSSALARTIFGSNAIQTMVRLSWPVIAVPAQMKYRAIKKIALACDLNHAAELVPVNYLKSMVTDFNCQLDVINIGSDNYFSPGDVFESGLLRKKLQPLNPRYHFITAKDVNEAILDFIEMNEVDLLMVLPRIHGLLDRLFYRSHTKHLVLHSHVPVMAIHSPGLKTP